jgi:hypothetical protein
MYNLAFAELRMFVENSYQRIQAWFPNLASRRKLFDANEDVFI